MFKWCCCSKQKYYFSSPNFHLVPIQLHKLKSFFFVWDIKFYVLLSILLFLSFYLLYSLINIELYQKTRACALSLMHGKFNCSCERSLKNDRKFSQLCTDNYSHWNYSGSDRSLALWIFSDDPCPKMMHCSRTRRACWTSVAREKREEFSFSSQIMGAALPLRIQKVAEVLGKRPREKEKQKEKNRKRVRECSVFLFSCDRLGVYGVSRANFALFTANYTRVRGADAGGWLDTPLSLFTLNPTLFSQERKRKRRRLRGWKHPSRYVVSSLRFRCLNL